MRRRRFAFLLTEELERQVKIVSNGQTEIVTKLQLIIRQLINDTLLGGSAARRDLIALTGGFSSLDTLLTEATDVTQMSDLELAERIMGTEAFKKAVDEVMEEV